MSRALHTREGVETGEVYTIGPLASPILRFQWIDDQGCEWIVDEPTGWDAAEIDLPLDRRPAGNGAWAGRPTFLERPLSFDGMVKAPSPAAAKAARRRLIAALQGDRTQPFLYSQPDEDGITWSLWVYPTGKPNARLVGRACVFAFVLVAEDPIKFGPSATYGPARLPTGTGDPGRKYPKVYPYRYNQGGAQVVTSVTVPDLGGDEAGHALYVIKGPVPSPVLSFSTGPVVTLNLTLGAQDTAVVDSRSGTVTVNGVNRYDALRAQFIPLIPPGGVTIAFRSAGNGTNQGATLNVVTAPARR